MELFKNAVTFRHGRFGHGCGNRVSIYNVQKEVCGVVVGLTEIALNKIHSNLFQYKFNNFKTCQMLEQH